ncbi:malonyl CoA-acyl carrier protein transacylase [Halobacteriovorax marinus]|uniref:Malonyl CoA-acyl carrier protein transacylase n=1 Tax=Halobacteriovorax marinus (strain ATCC BAA-682 / DSM 15412 / SJ) TaxID=862908 RepID=E1WY12_HALMS|nr:ACP S-malonyltransferase [Halobacteriovorax marinus]ATH08865.1 malonyl CoA-acyl carrier protein transacylase [Halobacteriovorax marinus]CBW27567.1 malonyl CoA-acyl carrier protein transacylase [Halobacteriovorax marinus SJ]
MTKSVTLLFPGQGAQYVGMGKSLEGHSAFNLFEKANQALGFNLTKMMFEGPEEDLKLTKYTQPAILSHSVALFEKAKEILEEKNVKIDRVLGHSVGEYAALVAAGAISYEDALNAVHLRGTYMQDAVPAGKGKMFAIMKVPEDKILEACKAASTEGSEVMPANFNEPSQIVISGEADACDRAVKWLEENWSDPYRAVELKVSAPFHSSLMEPAAKNLKEAFAKFKFNDSTLPYIANIDAKEYAAGTSAATIQDNLIKQVDGSVLWTQSIQELPDDTICIECGPGRVLMGLVRKINRNIKVISLDKDGAFDELKELLS